MTVTAIISNQSESAPSTPESLGAPTADEMRTIFFGDAEPIACEQFIRPGQVAPDRPATDACIECGLPEEAHAMTALNSGGGSRLRERLERLDMLGPDQVAAGLAWLAKREPEVFDAVLAAACTWDDGVPVMEADLEPWCTECGDTIGIFFGYGQEWHHFRGEGTREQDRALRNRSHPRRRLAPPQKGTASQLTQAVPWCPTSSTELGATFQYT